MQGSWILTGATVFACLAAGCGSGPRAAAGTPGRRGHTAAAYRWVVPTSGPQPSVAQENRHRGTSAWRLPSPTADIGGLAYGSVTGYVSEQAVLPGQRERIYVSAPGARDVRISVYRIGWYNGRGGREVLRSASLPAVSQPPCVHQAWTGLTECNWKPLLSFTIPLALPSGAYIVRMSTTSAARDCLFVVLARRPQPLLAQLPTSTYEAYNAWGGDSLYPGGADRVGVTRTTQGVEVSYDRPYDSVTGAGEFFARDVAMVRFLERYGYPVSYTTSESVDQHPRQLLHHRAVIDFGHSEYWSTSQEQGFRTALRSGVSLLFFGSDTMAWRVRYAPATRAASEADQGDHTILGYKQFVAKDPDRTDPSGKFQDGGANLTGSEYTGCITPRLHVSGPPTYLYYPWTPAPALAPAWLFTRSGVTSNTRIPGIVGYELDQRTPLTPPGTQLVGFGSAECMARREAGERLVGSADLAESTLYATSSGAIVFNTGTLGWELGLEPVPSASPDAPRAPERALVAITRNLLGHVLALEMRSASAAAAVQTTVPDG